MVKFSREPRRREAASADSQMPSAASSSSTQHSAWTIEPGEDAQAGRVDERVGGGGPRGQRADLLRGPGRECEPQGQVGEQPGVIGGLPVARRLDQRT